MASFALKCEQAREGHFVGGFRTCCPLSHDVGLSSKGSFAFLEQWWADQWLCMRTLPKQRWRRKFPVLTWKVQRHPSPVTPGDSGFLVKLSSASALPCTKAPPFPVQWSIFHLFADIGPICQCSLGRAMACTWILLGIVGFLIKVKDCSW